MLRRILPPTLLALAAAWFLAPAGQAQPAALSVPAFDTAFWTTWADGHAELAGYDLTYPRYGALRSGTAVTVFVTEPFSDSLRVKADPGMHPDEDVFPVMKLNLVQDFATGIYDYNLMTSAFVALQGVNGRPAGTPTKVTFSSQEWCGQVWQQALFDRTNIRHTLHSYFDGEADQRATLDFPADGVAEDALPLWARGFAAPVLAPGETRTVPLLRSLERARLRHLPVTWEQAVLERGADPVTVTVPAGTFQADVYTAAVQGDDGENVRTWTFYVERDGARRLVKWESTDGHRAELLGSKRLQYWKMNAPGFEDALKDLGLQTRPPRTT